MQLKSIFHSINRNEQSYSSTDNVMLTSTTLRLGSQHYCAHCGEKASPVQAGLCSFAYVSVSYHDRDFETTDHRCYCPEALQEMTDNLALDVLDMKQKSFLTERDDVPEKVLKVLMSAKRISFHDLKHLSITIGHSDDSFFEANKSEISLFAKDSYFFERPLALFASAVNKQVEALISRQKDELTRKIEKMKNPLPIELTAAKEIA
jgi:hypothetical protein